MDIKKILTATIAGIAITYGGNAMAKEAKAILAGGCFWCVEHDLQPIDGVINVVSGYAGGSVDNPSYEEVSAGNSGHVESVEVTYDPDVISYEELLKKFWKKVDPTDGGGQFCDRGAQYRTVIFYGNDSEKATALKVKSMLEADLKQPIKTDIISFTNFYPAEDYHQDYAEKNPIRYKYYRWNCGRDQRVKQVWGSS